MIRNDTIQSIADSYSNCDDVKREIVPFTKTNQMTLLYCQALCDEKMISRSILPQIRRLYQQNQLENPEDFENHISLQLSILDQTDVTRTNALLFCGSVLVGFSHIDKIYSIYIPDIPARQTEETNIEVSIRGPKDGLVESIDINYGLIRRRLPVDTVAFETRVIGTKTNTKVGLIYDVEKISEPTLQLIRTKLEQLEGQIEELVSATQLEELISDSPYCLFPLSIYTGRPDYITSCILRGRFALLIDGVPGALIGPITLTMLLKTPEDTHFNFISASFGLLLRIFSLIISIFLPSFYVALTGYHQDQIPFPLLATIVTTRIGVPISTPMEMFLVLTLLETFKEAGFRLPSMIGQTLTVVGGLIIGDAAIRAGLTSPSMVVIAAISIVAGSTLISQTLSGTVSILRYVSVLISSILGMYGFMLSLLLLIVYLSTTTSYGVSYLAPIAPITLKDIGRSFLVFPRKMKAFVPKYLHKKS